ncbi:hypothetical protein Xph01_04290 [Micromonospora phaseoli]|nr:hypothetical protein Xph01_04290 [Micromonospora phaseoli]
MPTDTATRPGGAAINCVACLGMTEGLTKINPLVWVGVGGAYVATTLGLAVVGSVHPDPAIRQDSRAMVDRLLPLVPLLSFFGHTAAPAGPLVEERPPVPPRATRAPRSRTHAPTRHAGASVDD